MAEKVYFIESNDSEDAALVSRLRVLLGEHGLLDFMGANDMVAVKSHVGEGKSGYVRPEYIRMIGDVVKGRGAHPFLTETSTLYKGNRSNAIRHMTHAVAQGFGFEAIGMPMICADGLYGDEEHEVEIPGKIYRSVKIAALLAKVQSMVMVSHFTGHMLAGFGAALKNMAMGCTSRRGKMTQHSTAKPKVKTKDCTGCGMCVTWCPTGAVTMQGEKALIDEAACIGCGQCLAVCRFYAVAFNWGATYEDIQKKIVEHAWGVDRVVDGRILYINFLTKISKDCDCMDQYVEICGDIGILVSRDPVAIDAASLALAEDRSGKKLPEMAFNIPYTMQIEYARQIGFGTGEYELVKV